MSDASANAQPDNLAKDLANTLADALAPGKPGGMNLHAAVRAAIDGLHPGVRAVLYQSAGQSVLPDGRVKTNYAPGIEISAQMQSESPAGLTLEERAGRAEERRKFYLRAAAEPRGKIAGLYRPLSRGGDLLQLEDGSWWLVEAMLEDFSRSGWAAVRAVLQVIPPDLPDSSGRQENENNNENSEEQQP